MLVNKKKFNQTKLYAEILKEKGVEIDFRNKYWVQKRLDEIDVEKDYHEFLGLIMNLSLFPLSDFIIYFYGSNATMGILMHQSYDYITYRRGKGPMITNPEKRNTDQLFFVLQFFDHRLTNEARKVVFDKINFLHTKFPGITNFKMVITIAFFIVGFPLLFKNALGEEKAKSFKYLGKFTDKFERAMHLLWEDTAKHLGISNPPKSYEESLSLVFDKGGFLDTIDTNYSEASHKLLVSMVSESTKSIKKKYPFLPKHFILNLLYSTMDKRALKRAGIKPKNAWFNKKILKVLAYGLRFYMNNFPAIKWKEPDFRYSNVITNYYTEKGLDPLIHGTDANLYSGVESFQNNPNAVGLKCPFGFSRSNPDNNKNTFTLQNFDKEEAKRRRENGLL